MVDVERLRIETYLVRQRFDSFVLRHLADGSFGFLGVLRTNGNQEYLVLIQLSPGYPIQPPKVFPVDPKITSPVHMYADGSLCLSLPEDWTPDKTISTVIGWVSHWLHNYEVYTTTKIWPAKGV